MNLKLFEHLRNSFKWNKTISIKTMQEELLFLKYYRQCFQNLSGKLENDGFGSKISSISIYYYILWVYWWNIRWSFLWIVPVIHGFTFDNNVTECCLFCTNTLNIIDIESSFFIIIFDSYYQQGKKKCLPF